MTEFRIYQEFTVRKAQKILKSKVTFHNKPTFYGEESLAPHLTPKFDDYLLLAVCDCCAIYSQLPSMSGGCLLVL
jgi:hypothetical protein